MVVEFMRANGGIAPGIDRIVMLLADEPNIREVITFQENTETELVRFRLAREPTTIEQRSWGQLKKSSRLLDRRVP